MTKQRLLVTVLVISGLLWGFRAMLGEEEKGPGRTVEGPEDATVAVRPPFHYDTSAPDPFYCAAFMEKRIVKKKSTKKKTRTRKKRVVRLPACSIGGIVYNADNPMALFVYKGKSTLVKKGDVIEGIRIAKVSRDSVKVVYKGKRFMLGR